MPRPISATAASRPPSLSPTASKRVDEVEPEVQAWAFLDRDHVMRQAQAADEHRRHGRRARAAARRAGRHQGHFRHRRLSDRIRLAAVERTYAAAGRGRGRAAARGRRRDHGQDRDGRIRLLPSRQDAQSARPGAHAGRLVERLGGGRRSRDGAGRDRLADQRLDHPPGRLLRRGRIQADAWPHPAHRRADAVARARPCRRVRPHGRGRGLAGRSHGGTRRRGRRHAPARAAAARRRRGERAAVAAAVRLRAHAGVEVQSNR